MNQQKSYPRKRVTGMGGVKYMILSVGLTSILGFWGLFARQSAAAELAKPTSGGNNNTLFVRSSVSNYIALPPLPTLVPPGAPGSLQAGLPSNYTTWNPPSALNQFFGNGNSGQFIQPSPFTTTRSSR